MAKKKTTRKRSVGQKSVRARGSPRKDPAGTEYLGKEWKLGEIAWNADGNIIILQPSLAKFLRKKVLKDREFEIGIPKTPVRVGSAPGGGTRVPHPDGDILPPRPKGWRGPLELCVCNSLQLYLIKDAPVQHKLLSSEPAH